MAEHSRPLRITMVSLLLVGCASALTRPDDMSAAAHRQKAAELRRRPDGLNERRAEQHEQAALELERFADAQCKGVPVEARSTCPLRLVVASVEEIPRGARLRLVGGADSASVLEHMRCHSAFGRQEHYEGMPACPLYLPGIDVALGADGSSVTITSDDPDTRDRIRGRAEAHVSKAARERGPRSDSSWTTTPTALNGTGF